MIAYFDASAFVPLIVREPASEQAWTLWSEADRVVSVRLLYVEARAALAAGRRQGRIPQDRLARALALLDALDRRVDHVDVDADLVRRAGAVAEQRALRTLDAVHLAAAERVADDELLFAAGDRALCEAARASGLRVSRL